MSQFTSPAAVRLARPAVALLALALLALAPAPVGAQQAAAPPVAEYQATVAASLEAEVSPWLDGLLTKMDLTPGQFVNKGDLLFEFDARDKQLSVALAKARLKQAEAQLHLAEAALKIAQSLRTNNVATELQFLEADARKDVAAAELEEARASLQLADLTLEQTRLYAPISGIVSRPLVSIGTYITKQSREQSRLATIVQLDPVHVIGRAPAAAYLHPGAPAKTMAQAAEQREFSLVLPTGETYPHRGRFISGGYAFDPATQTVEVTAEFPNPDLLLRPGLDVTLRAAVANQ